MHIYLYYIYIYIKWFNLLYSSRVFNIFLRVFFSLNIILMLIFNYQILFVNCLLTRKKIKLQLKAIYIYIHFFLYYTFYKMNEKFRSQVYQLLLLYKIHECRKEK